MKNTRGGLVAVLSALLIVSFFVVPVVSRAGGAGTPDHLAFTFLPGLDQDPNNYFPNITAGQPFTVQVTVQDANNNTVTTATNDVSLDTLSGGVGGGGCHINPDGSIACPASNCPRASMVQGTLEKNAVDGIVTFDDLTYDVACFQAFSLIARSSSLPGTAQSLPYFNVNPGPAAQIGFDAFPENLHPNDPFSLIVRLQDQFGNLVSDHAFDRVTVRLELGTHSYGTTLDGVTGHTFERGAASFPGLSIGTVGDYTIVASIPELPGFATIESDSFSVTKPASLLSPTSKVVKMVPAQHAEQ